MNINKFLKKISSEIRVNFKSVTFDKVSDLGYVQFLQTINGGYFFENGVHFYSVNAVDDYNDLENNNCILGKLYDFAHIDDLYFIGQDVFGNQFAINNSNNSIVSLNIETGDFEWISQNFLEFISKIYNDYDYFAGTNLINKLERNYIEDLANGFRLCPKYPFVLGGSYEIENLYLKFHTENLKFNATLAKQIYEKEDGTDFTLSF